MYKMKRCENCGKQHNNQKFCCSRCIAEFNWRKENSPYKKKSYIKKLSDGRKEWLKTHEHPKGMLGKKQTEKMRKISSEMCKKRIGKKHPNWKGGCQAYWNRKARRILKNTPNVCKICGVIKNIEVHHLNRDITDNRTENLLKVCSCCHHFLHRDNLEKLKEGYKKYVESRKW
jgi:hypothetical protein